LITYIIGNGVGDDDACGLAEAIGVSRGVFVASLVRELVRVGAASAVLPGGTGMAFWVAHGTRVAIGTPTLVTEISAFVFQRNMHESKTIGVPSPLTTAMLALLPQKTQNSMSVSGSVDNR
jgi:hypothetical protein